MKKIKLFICVLICIISLHEGRSQIYAGGSYVYGQLSESGLDQFSGFSFDLQGEFKSSREKVVFIPTLRLAVLDSKVYNQAYPFYAKNLSFSPLVAFRLIEFKNFSISPYGGPFVSRLEGRRAESLLFPAAYISDTRIGGEFGIEFKIRLYDYLTVKLNPINLIFGNEFYRQGHLNVLVNF